MAASERRKLFARGEPEHPLTPLKLGLLLWLAECTLLTPIQLAGLSGLTLKSVREHLRHLFDLGLVDRKGIPRAALAGLDAPNGPNLLWGSAPTIYVLSKEGIRCLVQAGMADRNTIQEPPDYGPKNALFLAHELLVRDARVWLERVKRRYGHAGVTRWVDGTRATISLERKEYPREVRPDAWVTYELNGGGKLALFVEADRGTERSPSRWQDKLAQYAPLLVGSRVKEVTGLERGRVLVVAPDAARRDQIAGVIASGLPGTGLGADRFWLCARAALDSDDLGLAAWRVPGVPELQALVPPQYR